MTDFDCILRLEWIRPGNSQLDGNQEIKRV